MSQVKEVIKHAAIIGTVKLSKVLNIPSVFIGKSHADCFHQADNIGIKLAGKADDQGFVTSKGRYVTRSEAAKIAVRAGQVSKGTKVLCSEDIWSKRHGGKFKYDSVKGYHL